MGQLLDSVTVIEAMRSQLVAERGRLLEANCEPTVLNMIDTLLSTHDAAAECIARDTVAMVASFQEFLRYTKGT